MGLPAAELVKVPVVMLCIYIRAQQTNWWLLQYLACAPDGH